MEEAPDVPEPENVDLQIDQLEEDDISVHSEEGRPFQDLEYFQNNEEEYAQL